MKIINVNRKCADCPDETGDCVKVYSKDGNNYCFDSRDAYLMTELIYERDHYKKLFRISCFTAAAIAVIAVIILFIK